MDQPPTTETRRPDPISESTSLRQTSSSSPSPQKASAEERGIMSSDSTLSSSWWELYNDKTGRYYWNAVTNATQYVRPSCLGPKVGNFSGKHRNRIFGKPTKPSYMKYMQAFPADVASEKVLPPPNYNMYTPPAGTLMEGSSALNLFPTKEAHVPSFTTSMGCSAKDSLYLSFALPGAKIKWYYLNLGGSREEEIVKESGLKTELITTLLDVPTGDCYASSVVVNSSIYRCFTRGNRSSSTCWLQVLDIKDRVGLVAEYMLVKALYMPWAVHMGGKIYVVGAEFPSDRSSPFEINRIEVFTPGDSSSETLPLISTEVKDWLNYFVVAVEDIGKLVFGIGDMSLFLYDVGTHQLEKIDLEHWIPWCRRRPPVAVGNILFLFIGARIFAFDLVERSYWYGTIDGLDDSFLKDRCDGDEDPRLVYLGGGKLCLICLASDTHDKNKCTLTCCLFNVPEFMVQAGYRSLHGQVYSLHLFSIEYTHGLADVLLI